MPHIFADKPNPRRPNSKVDRDNFYLYVGPYGNGEIYKANPKHAKFMNFDGYLLVENEKVTRVFKKDEYESEIKRVANERALEEVRRSAEISDKTQRIISEKNLTTLYRRDNFFILKDNGGIEYYIKDGVLASKSDASKDIAIYETEKQRILQTKRLEEREKYISNLQSEYTRSGGDLSDAKRRFEIDRCFGWVPKKYGSYESCVMENSFTSASWENTLKIRIEKINAKNLEKRNAEIAREKCLSNGAIGICQSSSQNNNIYLCDQNSLVGLENIFNKYCYTTDTVNVYSKMDVRNNLHRSVSDISFECSQVAKSGTVLKRDNQVIFETWQPREVKLIQLKSLKHQQVAQVICRAVSWR
jgi:hypothetical protein